MSFSNAHTSAQSTIAACRCAPALEPKIEAYLDGDLLLPDFVSAFVVEGLKTIGYRRSREQTIAALGSTETGTDALFKSRVSGRNWLGTLVPCFGANGVRRTWIHR